MTSAGQVQFRRAATDRAVGAHSLRWRAIGVACGIAALLQVVTPAPAYAWWGKLEKLSGPSGLSGPQFDFRVVCFGEKPVEIADAESRATGARRLTQNERATGKPNWAAVADQWRETAHAWAVVLGEPRSADQTGTDEQRAERWQREAERLEGRVRARLMATSSVGVLWSLCRPDKERRLALDVNWGVWGNEGEADYAGGAPVELQTLMTSVSWRLLADSNWDFVEVSAGAGVYWFSSTGFPSKNGVVLQPGRVTFRAPSSWSGKKLKDWRRWAAIPVYGIGITVFPAGFEATDFAGTGDKAVRIPSELLTTQYFFLNVEPFLRMARK